MHKFVGVVSHNELFYARDAHVGDLERVVRNEELLYARDALVGDPAGHLPRRNPLRDGDPAVVGFIKQKAQVLDRISFSCFFINYSIIFMI